MAESTLSCFDKFSKRMRPEPELKTGDNSNVVSKLQNNLICLTVSSSGKLLNRAVSVSFSIKRTTVGVRRKATKRNNNILAIIFIATKIELNSLKQNK